MTRIRYVAIAAFILSFLVPASLEAGNLIYGDTNAPPWPLPSPRQYAWDRSEYFSNSQHGNWYSGSGNTGTALAITSEPGHPGIEQLSTFTSATGYARAGYGLNAQSTSIFLFGDGTYRYETEFRLPILSDAGGGTEEYEVRCGFTDNAAPVNESVDGVFFRYKRSVSANWIGVARANSQESTVDTTVAAATGWHRFEITIAPDAASAVFTVDTTSVRLASANIPHTAGRETGLGCGIGKVGTGVTARVLDIDYQAWSIVFTTPR